MNEQENLPNPAYADALREIKRLRAVVKRLTGENIKECARKSGQRERAEAAEQRAEQLKAGNKAGWRSCIDHIIKPEHACPVCRADQLQDKLDAVAELPEKILAIYPPDVWPDLPDDKWQEVREWLAQKTDEWMMDVSGRIHATWARHLAEKVIKRELEQLLGEENGRASRNGHD